MIDLKYEDGCIGWTKDHRCNSVYLSYTISYLRQKYQMKTYMYLNDIYEHFGFKWDPNKENICWCNGMNLIIDYEQIENTSDFIIHIY